MDIVSLARALSSEAGATNERRLLVLAGERERGYDQLESILDVLPVAITDTTLLGPEDRLRCPHHPIATADRLLGTTRQLIALDAHDELQPNALGSIVGAVDGGGLLVLLTPPFEEWPGRRGGFHRSLAVSPFSIDDVTGRFVERLVETLSDHRGIAIVDVDAGRIRDDGLTQPAPRDTGTDRSEPPSAPEQCRFPAAAYDACLTTDQVEALTAFETLSDGPNAVVVEADRGRGKSSVAGLAAGAFAAAGERVLVVGPSTDSVSELFRRASVLLEDLDVAPPDTPTDDESARRAVTEGIRTATDGEICYRAPGDVAETPAADLVIVDEAAAIPVAVLERFLAVDRVAFVTTVHGYEGAGRGFSVRFRDRLDASRHDVVDVRLVEPIRYAPGDPIEVWAFRALCLDARPPVAQLVEGARPESATYRRLSPEDLLADEPLLRAVFGLLVLAHYRTEPNDLARLLDAPNLETRVLSHDGHVVSVALLAREGPLPPAVRATLYEGGRIPGNMIPDVLTSQVRDEDAGACAGVRIVRIATHHAVRSQGLGSHLLECITEEISDTVDWLGAGFGATPSLLSFWRQNGYRSVYTSTTQNDASGEHSAVVLRPSSDDGADLLARHTDWFVRRMPAALSDVLSDLDPAVVHELLKGVDATVAPPLELSDHEWRVVAGAAYGPGLFDVDPGPFRRLVVRSLIDETPTLEPETSHLLIRRVLQCHDWEAVADELDYHSTRTCMRALGGALVPLVDAYGPESARGVRDRFEAE